MEWTRLGLLGMVLWQSGPATQPSASHPEIAQRQYLRYERPIAEPGGIGQACAVLDARIFPHAAPSLADLRVLPAQGAQAGEIPYVITLSQTVTQETDAARVLNLRGSGAGKIAFDLEMPARAYSDVVLDLAARDFVASATVWGEDTSGAPEQTRTRLGSFTVFDLSSQRLARETTLPLAESTAPYLHVELAVSPAPGTPGRADGFVPAMVTAAEVPPSRTSQTIYTSVAETHAITSAGGVSRAMFAVPARVPVERVSFELAPGFKGNFSRSVRIVATPEPSAAGSAARQSTLNAAESIAAGADLEHGALPGETVQGTILRVHAQMAGRAIRAEQLAVPAVLGANLQSSAKVVVELADGGERPLPVTAVRLAMRQRRLCFDAGADTSADVALFYGDPELQAPRYGYQRSFRTIAQPLAATLGPEVVNPQFRARPVAARPFTQRHPEALWIAVIAAVCALGMVALRRAKTAAQ